jgi:hypothetical protein
VEHHATQNLELVHNDVYGSLKVQSLEGAKYFVTFVDDYSRKTCVYMMKRKDEVLAKFKNFKNDGKIEAHGQHILMLRLDNGENILALFSLIFAKPVAFDVNSLCPTHLNTMVLWKDAIDH